MLRYEGIARLHGSEVFPSFLLVDAWQRQSPHLPCPLKFEDGRLLRHLAPESRGEDGKWEEDFTIRLEYRWLKIPQVSANSFITQESEAEMTIRTIPAVVFIGVVEGKHQCRPASEKELQGAETESPVKGLLFQICMAEIL